MEVSVKHTYKLYTVISSAKEDRNYPYFLRVDRVLKGEKTRMGKEWPSAFSPALWVGWGRFWLIDPSYSLTKQKR